MASKRSKKRQSDHDQLVPRVAGGYKSQGWKVQADLPGQERPPVVNGFRPDVLARKGRQQRMIEVETPDTVDATHSQDQARAFRRWSRGRSSRKFSRKVTND